jgi:hypothetical protein
VEVAVMGPPMTLTVIEVDPAAPIAGVAVNVTV